MAGHWVIDGGVADELAERLGWSTEDGAAALAQRMPERIPVGSTAKLAAIAAGEVPPGADPDDLAEQMLRVIDMRVSPATSASPSWSCWAMATVMAGLVETVGGWPARVVGLRRVDDRSPIVDFHSVVAIETGEATWICDPYFGATGSGRAPDGTATVATHSSSVRWPASAEVTSEPDGRWTWSVRLVVWDGGLRYRVIAPDLDRGDVAALCAVSVEHSGVPSRPYARLHAGPGIISAHEAEDGTATCSTWARPTAEDGRHREASEVVGVVPADPTVTTFPTWPAAADHFARLTGVTII